MHRGRLPAWIRHTSLMTCVVFVYVNVVYAVVAPAQVFWKERKAAAEKLSLPPGMDMHILPQNPSSLSPVLTVPETAPFLKSALRLPRRPLPKWIESVSASYVTLKDLYLPPSWKPGDFMVLHIQDAHGNAQAQENIARVLESLAKEEKGMLLGIEGARGAFNFHPFRSFPDPKVIKEIADYFLKEGFITGPEYVGMTSENLPTFWGVEDEALYLSHVQALKDATVLKKEVIEKIGEISAKLEGVKDRELNPALRELDRKITLHHQGKMDLGEYLKFLTGKPSSQPSPLQGEGGSFPTDSPLLEKERARVRMPPAISKFLSALELEESLNYEQMEKERSFLTLALSREIPRSELENLVKAGISYRLGDLTHSAFYEYLKNLCQVYGINPGNYPEMDKYIRYVLASEGIKTEELLSEAMEMEGRVLENSIKAPREREIIDQSENFGMMEKLVKFELSPEEWEKYTAKKPQIGHVLSDLLRPFERFNELAAARNGALVRNLLKKAEETKSGLAVLVTGGYHTEGMTEILKKKQTAYAVLTPRLGKAEGSGSEYLDVFIRDKTPLEKLFTGERIQVASQGIGPRVSMGEMPDKVPTLERMTAALAKALSGRILPKQFKAWFGKAGFKTVNEISESGSPDDRVVMVSGRISGRISRAWISIKQIFKGDVTPESVAIVKFSDGDFAVSQAKVPWYVLALYNLKDNLPTRSQARRYLARLARDFIESGRHQKIAIAFLTLGFAWIWPEYFREILGSAEAVFAVAGTTGPLPEPEKITADQEGRIIEALTGHDDARLYQTIAEVFELKGSAVDIAVSGNHRPAEGLLRGGVSHVTLVDRVYSVTKELSDGISEVEADATDLVRVIGKNSNNVAVLNHAIGPIIDDATVSVSGRNLEADGGSQLNNELFLVDILHHVFFEIQKVLKPGGRIIINTNEGLDGVNWQLKGLKIEDALATAGFEQIRSFKIPGQVLITAVAAPPAAEPSGEASFDDNVRSLAGMIGDRDIDYTGAHSERVRNLTARFIGVLRRQGMSISEREEIFILAAAVLHDLGKIKTPWEILHKVGHLVAEEQEIMRRHVDDGVSLLEEHGLAHVAQIVWHSHEAFDGNGYPKGTKGTDIPLGSRIIFIVDAFDAMTSDRPYRKGMPVTEALERLREVAGTQFDPDIVAVFVNMLSHEEPAPSASPTSGPRLKKEEGGIRIEILVGMALMSAGALLAGPAGWIYLGLLMAAGLVFLSVNRQVDAQVTQFLQRNAAADVENLNTEELPVFADVYQNPVPHLHGFLGLARLKLYVQRVRFLVESYVHRLRLLKPISRDDDDVAVQSAVNSFQSPYSKPPLGHKPISKTGNDIIRTPHRLFNLLFGKVSLKNPQFDMLGVDQGHISEVTRVGPASQARQYIVRLARAFVESGRYQEIAIASLTLGLAWIWPERFAEFGALFAAFGTIKPAPESGQPAAGPVTSGFTELPGVEVLRGGKKGASISDVEPVALADPLTGLPLGSGISRKIAHDDGHWHLTVHVYLVDSRGRIVLQRRSQNMPTSPGRIQASVSGHVDAPDVENLKSPQDSSWVELVADREALEEAGINLDRSKLMRISEISEVKREQPNNKEFTTVLFYSLSDEEMSRVQSGFNTNEVEELALIAGGDFRRIVEAYPDEFSGSVQHLVTREPRILNELLRQAQLRVSPPAPSASPASGPRLKKEEGKIRIEILVGMALMSAGALLAGPAGWVNLLGVAGVVLIYRQLTWQGHEEYAHPLPDSGERPRAVPSGLLPEPVRILPSVVRSYEEQAGMHRNQDALEVKVREERVRYLHGVAAGEITKLHESQGAGLKVMSVDVSGGMSQNQISVIKHAAGAAQALHVTLYSSNPRADAFAALDTLNKIIGARKGIVIHPEILAGSDSLESVYAKNLRSMKDKGYAFGGIQVEYLRGDEVFFLFGPSIYLAYKIIARSLVLKTHDLGDSVKEAEILGRQQ